MTSVPQTATGWVEIGKGKYQITAWVTMKVTAEWNPDYPGMISWYDAGSPWRRFAHGRDWHYTEAEAIKRACEMRDRRVASLKKQIAAIAAMKFEVK